MEDILTPFGLPSIFAFSINMLNPSIVKRNKRGDNGHPFQQFNLDFISIAFNKKVNY